MLCDGPAVKLELIDVSFMLNQLIAGLDLFIGLCDNDTLN